MEWRISKLEDVLKLATQNGWEENWQPRRYALCLMVVEGE